MSLASNKVGVLIAEIDSGGALRSAGDRVLLGPRNLNSELEWTVRQKMAECSASIIEIIHAHRGVVTTRSAESIVASFPHAERCFHAACEMQRYQQTQIEAAFEKTNSAPLGLRLGISYGKVLVDAGQVSGETLDAARGIAGRASAGQIIAAESLVNALGDEVRGMVSSLGVVHVDAVGEVEVFEVQWDPQAPKVSESSYAHTLALMEPEPEPQLRVSSRGKEIVLDSEHPFVTLRSGKQREPHARLEFRDSSFYLVNLRANGTRIKNGDDEEQLCLDELELTGEGAITLGEEFKEDAPDLLRFSRVS